MKDTRKIFTAVSFFDHTHVEAMLERMARRGWMLERIGSYFWTYRRIEPKEIRFTVSYCPRASAFDPDLTEEQREFIDFCERTGWRFVASNAQLQVFCNEQRDPVPIHTDPALELETLHRAAKRVQIPMYCVLLVLAAAQLVLFSIGLWNDPIKQLANGSALMSIFAWLMLTVLCGGELITYLLWRRRALKAAERGEFLATPNLSAFARAMLVVVLAVFAVWVVSSLAAGEKLLRFVVLVMLAYMAILLTAVNGTKNLLKRKGAPRGVNRAATIAVDVVLAFGMMALVMFAVFRASENDWFDRGGAANDAPAPLTIRELADAESSDYKRYWNDAHSLLLGRIEVHEYPGGWFTEGEPVPPDLKYTITDVKAVFLYDFCKDRLLHAYDPDEEDIQLGFAKDYKPADAAPWGAEEAYRLYWREDGSPLDRWLLRYGDRFVELDLDWEPTAEQMAAVGERLGTY